MMTVIISNENQNNVVVVVVVVVCIDGLDDSHGIGNSNNAEKIESFYL